MDRPRSEISRFFCDPMRIRMVYPNGRSMIAPTISVVTYAINYNFHPAIKNTGPIGPVF